MSRDMCIWPADVMPDGIPVVGLEGVKEGEPLLLGSILEARAAVADGRISADLLPGLIDHFGFGRGALRLVHWSLPPRTEDVLL